MDRRQRQKQGDLLRVCVCGGGRRVAVEMVLNFEYFKNKELIEFSDGQDVEYKRETSRTKLWIFARVTGSLGELPFW